MNGNLYAAGGPRPSMGDRWRAVNGSPALLLSLAVGGVVAASYAVELVVIAGWPVSRSLSYAATAAVSGGCLSAFVWVVTGAVPVDRPRGIALYVVHVALVIVGGGIGLAASMGARYLILGERPFAGRAVGMEWQLTIVGLTYAAATFLAYAMRERTRWRSREAHYDAMAHQAARDRLAAIRARLNPHFLFNTLNSLGGLARRDLDRFDDATERLGNLLRHALRSDYQGAVTLGDEIALVEDYLALEQLRLAERLRVTWDISEDARDAQVPSLFLQPLFENAIHHGIELTPAGGVIHCEAAVRDHRLVISVVDSGPGADAQRDEGFGLGLRELRQRLALLYPAFLLAASLQAEGGYVVRVEIPQ